MSDERLLNRKELPFTHCLALLMENLALGERFTITESAISQSVESVQPAEELTASFMLKVPFDE